MVMATKVAEMCFIINHKCIVHCVVCGLQGRVVDEKLLAKAEHVNQENYNPFCDSQSTIHLAKNPSFHSRTKHINVRYHWIREVVSFKLVKLDKIHIPRRIARI
jgi:hypothetical protein